VARNKAFDALKMQTSTAASALVEAGATERLSRHRVCLDLALGHEDKARRDERLPWRAPWRNAMQAAIAKPMPGDASWRERPLTGGEREIKVSRERCFPYSPTPSHL
jgi:hypothetical protein